VSLCAEAFAVDGSISLQGRPRHVSSGEKPEKVSRHSLRNRYAFTHRNRKSAETPGPGTGA
jgi:hypothetical protein